MPKQPSAVCEHKTCGRIAPAEYVVGDEHHSEAWCNRCVYNMELTTPPDARPKVRLITPEWSER